MGEDIGKEEVRRRFDSLARKRLQWKARNKYYYEDQKKYYRFLVPEGLSILELGCGTGDLVHALKPRRGVGIDFSPEMIKIANELYPELEFRAEDVEELENWGESFDVLIMADVVGHLRDIEETFRGLRSFCRPETRFIVSYYNFLWEPILKIGEVLNLKMPQQYQNWLSSEDICNLLSLAKFQIVKTECRLLIPKKIPLLSNFTNRYVAALPGIRKLCLCRYIVARPIQFADKRDFSTTILIPCRNEKGNIEAAIKRIPEFGKDQEIVFVEGNSTDGTYEEIERVLHAYSDRDIKLISQDGKGKGDAVRKGFSVAK